MDNKQQGKKYALISSLLLTLYAVWCVISNLYIFGSDSVLYQIHHICIWIGLFGLSVALFIRNKKAVLIISSIVSLAYILIGIFSRYFYMDTITTIFSYAALVVIIILSSKNNQIIKYVWFIPGLIRILYFLFIFVNVARGNHILRIFNPPNLSILVESLALLFAGLWIKTISLPVSMNTLSKKAISPTQSSVCGGAEKLKAFKELLDAGAITQEEFDAKKKEILG